MVMASFRDASQSEASEPELHYASSAGSSPRGSVSFIDAALGYYDVLSLVKPAQHEHDEYELLDFQAPPTNRTAPSSLSPAHLANLHAAAATRISQATGKLHSAASGHLRNIRGRLAPARYLRTLRWTPHRVLLRDKLTFVLSIAHIALSAFWLGRSPSTFYQLYTYKAMVLGVLRFILYKRDKMHYYLLDFCYYANLLLILQAWALPEWCALEQIVFAFCTGPLAWSILAFRNSLILHSLDKMTSVFLHAFPPLVVWTQRWYPGDPGHWKTIASKSCEAKTATVRDLIVIPWIPYAIWAVAYYLKIFVISSRRIQERGYHTLFKYVIRKPKSVFGRMHARLPRWLSPLIYMVWHVMFCAVTFVLAWACWHSFWLHTAFVATMLGVSAWNGSTYYFDVFAAKYLEQMGIEKGQRAAEGGRAQSEDVARPDGGFADAAEAGAGGNGVPPRCRSEGDIAEAGAWPLAQPAEREGWGRAAAGSGQEGGEPPTAAVGHEACPDGQEKDKGV